MPVTREALIARCNRRRKASSDPYPFAGLLTLQVPGDLVQLGEPAGLLVRNQQLDVGQLALEFGLDPRDKLVDPLAALCRDQRRRRMAPGQLRSAVIVD